MSSHHGDGTLLRKADKVDGIALQHARTRKEDRYPELCGLNGRARLVVVAGEVGRQWSRETKAFLKALPKPWRFLFWKGGLDPELRHLPSVYEVLADARREVQGAAHSPRANPGVYPDDIQPVGAACPSRLQRQWRHEGIWFRDLGSQNVLRFNDSKSETGIFGRIRAAKRCSCGQNRNLGQPNATPADEIAPSGNATPAERV